MKVNLSPFLLLLMGILLMAGTHMTISIGILAWIAYVPFLLYLHQTKGWKSRLWFFLAYLVAWSAVVFKIVTDPIPVFLIPMYSILRSTRFGLSAAITPYGEMVAQMSSFDQNDKIMLAHLPKSGVVSLYRLIGDTFVYLCIAFVLLFGIRLGRHQFI